MMVKCNLCQQAGLVLFWENPFERGVASDCQAVNEVEDLYRCDHCCHIQKNTSKRYIYNIKTIYRNYNMYTITGGREGKIYSVGGEEEATNLKSRISRSEGIYNAVRAYVVDSKRVLDVGTGTGPMLKTLSKYEPDWELYAYDLESSCAEDIRSISGVRGFFSGDLTDIKLKFDVIFLIHTLEHFVNIEEQIYKLQALLDRDGVIIIQVPNITDAPFDGLIYDHVSHYSVNTLQEFLAQYFAYVNIIPEQLYKEITIVVKGPMEFRPYKYSFKKHEGINHYLNGYANLIRSIDYPVEIFGTGPISVLSAILLGDKCVGFIDEDPLKIGKFLLDFPISSINEVCARKVILPFSDKQNRGIKRRLSGLPFVGLTDRRMMSA
jgi:2-polyprenyl-3-methyl-5-hydroxy-6-metoxy-1,4-benzoquinol methylase